MNKPNKTIYESIQQSKTSDFTDVSSYKHNKKEMKDYFSKVDEATFPVLKYEWLQLTCMKRSLVYLYNYASLSIGSWFQGVFSNPEKDVDYLKETLKMCVDVARTVLTSLEKFTGNHQFLPELDDWEKLPLDKKTLVQSIKKMYVDLFCNDRPRSCYSLDEFRRLSFNTLRAVGSTMSSLSIPLTFLEKDDLTLVDKAGSLDKEKLDHRFYFDEKKSVDALYYLFKDTTEIIGRFFDQ